MKKIVIGLMAATALTASAVSMAGGPDNMNAPATKDSGLYVGAGVGYGAYTGQYVKDAALKTTFKKTHNFVFGAHVGYDINKYVAAQVEYLYLPHLAAKASADADLTAQAFALEAKVMYPLMDGKVIPFADAGGALVIEGYAVAPKASHDTGRTYMWRPVVGAGAEYKVMPNLGVTVEYKAIIGSTSANNRNDFSTTQMGLVGINYYL